jgi:hypothetical protein
MTGNVTVKGVDSRRASPKERKGWLVWRHSYVDIELIYVEGMPS